MVKNSFPFILTALLVAIPLASCAQKKYKFQYREILLGQPSSYTLTQTPLLPQNAPGLFDCMLTDNKRKLTDSELRQLVQDLSFDRQNALIEKKICFVNWEI